MNRIKNGFLIAIEGVDGSGKSTLAQGLKEKLASVVQSVVLTKEPGGTALGEKVRSLLLHRECVIDAKAEFLLFAASRAQHFDELILPQLHKGAVVISDRMADSSLVYQGYGRGLPLPMLREINSWAMQDRKPDVTFYLKLSLEKALERIKKRNLALTAFEKESDLLQKTIAGFTDLYKDPSSVVVILDAALSPSQLCDQAFDAVCALCDTVQLSS